MEKNIPIELLSGILLVIYSFHHFIGKKHTQFGDF
jgi:hypothetical protein